MEFLPSTGKVRIGAVVNKVLRLCKISSQSSDHTNGIFCLVKFVNWEETEENPLTNRRYYLAKPTKLLTSVTLLGLTQLFTASIIDGSTITHSLETTCPKTLNLAKTHTWRIWHKAFSPSTLPIQFSNAPHVLSCSLSISVYHQ